MIDSYQNIDSNRAFCKKTFFSGDYACHKGFVLDSMLIECSAQAVAAHFGYNERITNTNQQLVGMLVSVDTFVFYHCVPENSPITVNIHKIDQFGDFNIYKSSISSREKFIAEGRIKVFSAPAN